MKTAISLPDEIFREADRMARTLGKSRSELYRDALSEYLARHGNDAITEAMNKAVEAVGEEKEQSLRRSAVRGGLGRSEW